MKAITIEIAEGNYFDVVDWYGRRAQGLCWDEMLGAVAEITHPRIGEARYRMETEDEAAARRAAWAAKSVRPSRTLLLLPPAPADDPADFPF